MSRIREAFGKEKAFIPFITAGDPDLETTEKILYQLEKAGANLIEIGIPFSDPVAEGEVIARANERALKNRITTDNIFAMLERMRHNIKIPIVFLTYMNPIFTYGKERFMKRCKEVGIDGVIIPDLPFEEREELLTESETYEIPVITLIAPTSKDRIKRVALHGKGFIYLVSSMGVTGVRDSIQGNIEEMVSEIRKVTDVPIAVGFGVSTPEQGKELAKYADGVIVGSAIVKLIEKHGRNSENPVYEYTKEMKKGINS